MMKLSPLVWIALGFAGGALIVGGKRRRDTALEAASIALTGVDTGPRCDAFMVVDEDQARLTFLRGYVASREAGNVDPWVIAEDVMRTYHPLCWPETAPRTPEELVFYDELFDDVLVELLEDGILDDAAFAFHENEFAFWHAETAQERFGGLNG